MTSALKPLFSCVAENEPAWFRKVQNLAVSIRQFGGLQAGAPIVANFVGGVDRRYSRWLSGLDVDVRVVKPMDRVHRYANKLRMLEHMERTDFDVLVALDCDVVVVGDIGDFLSNDALRAKPADCDVLSEDQWMMIFEAAGLSVPEKTFVTTSFGQHTYPYVNSGVLLIPRQLCAQMLALWSRFLFRFDELYDSNAELALRRKYNDQIALACALAAARFPVRPLPVGMNLPTHIRIHRSFRHQLKDVRIVHYHGQIDDRGFLVASKYRSVNRGLERFNRRRAEALGLPYDKLPRRTIRDRIKQGLSGQPWYHTTLMERLKARVRERSKPASERGEATGVGMRST
jgi:hypothetical protein